MMLMMRGEIALAGALGASGCGIWSRTRTITSALRAELEALGSWLGLNDVALQSPARA